MYSPLHSASVDEECGVVSRCNGMIGQDDIDNSTKLAARVTGNSTALQACV